jgi:hypothetical protein
LPSAAKEERSNAPSVIVVADILKQRDATPAAFGTPAPKAFESESDAPLPEPLALARRAPARDPVAELAALRDARMSRAPVEVHPPESVEPAEPTARVVAAVEIEPPQVEPEPEQSEWLELETVDVAPEPVAFRVSVPDPVPTLSVNHTTWHPRRQRRRAEVSVIEAGDSRTIELKEGESVGPFKVAEIGPTGVTFVHKGVEIQRRVGAPPQ